MNLAHDFAQRNGRVFIAVVQALRHQVAADKQMFAQGEKVMPGTQQSHQHKPHPHSQIDKHSMGIIGSAHV